MYILVKIFYLHTIFDDIVLILYNDSKDNKGDIMTTTVGMRELARNSHILEGYDYVDVEDKKTHEYKGLFISPKYADDVKKMLNKKQAQEMKKKLDEVMRFSGSVEIEDRFNNLSYKEIRKKIAEEKYGE